jgi:hypothetical protein
MRNSGTVETAIASPAFQMHRSTAFNDSTANIFVRFLSYRRAVPIGNPQPVGPFESLNGKAESLLLTDHERRKKYLDADGEEDPLIRSLARYTKQLLDDLRKDL